MISAVGGMKEPPVDRFIAGYFAGAEKAAPGIQTILDYSQDWDDQAKCKELALNQIARGSNIVFQVAGGCGLGALNGGGERGRLGNRRRRRPVVPRPAHPDERPEGSRLGRLPHDRVDPGRQLEGRRQRDLRPQGGRRRPRQGEPERAAGGRRPGRRDQAADRGRRDHRHPDRGRRQLSDASTVGARLSRSSRTWRAGPAPTRATRSCGRVGARTLSSRTCATARPVSRRRSRRRCGSATSRRRRR